MACPLFGANPFYKWMIAYYQLDPWEQISVKIWKKKLMLFMQDNTFENVVCKWVAILSQPQSA